MKNRFNMTTKITPTQAINGLKQREFPIKNSSVPKSKKRVSTKHRTKTALASKKELESPLTDIKTSLRQECMRLALFLKQETHRPGFVR